MKKIIMDFGCKIIRTAFVEDGKLIEVLVDNIDSETCIGNIYFGVVKKIFPSQFAFIDIGENKNGFLQLDDKKQKNLYICDNKKKLKIKQGDQIFVQGLKDQAEKKGVTVTTEISITGRYLILIIGNHDICISRKIKNKKERERLESICKNVLEDGYSVIVRTECENVKEEILKKEFVYLKSLITDILSKSKNIKSPCIVYKEKTIYEKSLKLLLKDDIDSIVINCESEEENIKKILNNYNLNENILSIYRGNLNIFLEYELEVQIEKALNKKVWLKSGGFLIIEKTEALTVIDVNSGKFTSKNEKKNFIFKTNLEAAVEIARQLRLRNLSGIIIIDFIDMRNEEDRNLLISTFSKEVYNDRVNVNIVGMTSLGLLQVTRKKTRAFLSNYFLSECRCCNKTGFIYRTDYILHKIYNKIYKVVQQKRFNRITVNASEKIINLVSKNYNMFEDLEVKFDIEIIFNKVNTLKLDYFEIKK